MLHTVMACKQNRGHAGRSSEAKSEYSSIALGPGSEVPMRFGPFFAREESLATRRNATDGTPPSGVAKINSHQYTNALWQRVVAVFVAVSMATSLTPSAAFANENAEGATASQPALSASSDAVSSDADAGDSQVGTDHASGEQGADAAGDAGAAGDALPMRHLLAILRVLKE